MPASGVPNSAGLPLTRWFLALTMLVSSLPAFAEDASLIGFAQLPADTFLQGPASGISIAAKNGRHPPFKQQPVQGFSALLYAGDGGYLVLSDNGYGRRNNSSDYLLSIYRVTPDFRTQRGGSGSILVNEIIQLKDPHSHIPYAIVDETDRILTGADLDPESFQMAADGSFWIGEEFIPSLLHVGPDGALLAPPYTLTGLASLDNPQGSEATLPRSRGFEGMARSPDGRFLYPMLEGALLEAMPGLNIYTFDTGSRQFVNSRAAEPSYRYKLNSQSTAIGSFKLYSDTEGLVLERDSSEGTNAVIKKIYAIDFRKVDDNGFLIKTEVADLLKLDDPHDLDQNGQLVFSFPFWTIEGLVVINQTTLGIVNDNNYPFGNGRTQGQDEPESSEFILIEVAPLWKK